MSTNVRSNALYAHPFSKAYWRDAAAELKSTKMLVVTALMIALRVALKPLAIPLGPQLSIQTAMLATALGAMIYGPVMAIPAAMISDTVGFMIFPTGDYFLPFMLTEIASTVIYALLLYRAKPTPIRVTITRFLICFLINVVVQQFIFAWQYSYMGNPDKAKDAITGIMTASRLLKNAAMFPIESVVLTLFLKCLLPITKRAGLTPCGNEDMRFSAKRIITLVVLTAIGIGATVGFFADRYSPNSTSSRSTDYSASQRMDINKEMTELVLEKTNDWDNETVVCIVDRAYRGLFQDETEYTVSIYTLDKGAFAAGQAADDTYNMDTLFGYSKSGPKKDKYQSLIKVGTATVHKDESSGEILSFELQ